MDVSDNSILTTELFLVLLPWAEKGRTLCHHPCQDTGRKPLNSNAAATSAVQQPNLLRLTPGRSTFVSGIKFHTRRAEGKVTCF